MKPSGGAPVTATRGPHPGVRQVGSLGTCPGRRTAAPPQAPAVAVLAEAIITVLAWGTWIPLASLARVPNEDARTFYVTLGNLALAVVVLGVHGGAGALVNVAALAPVGGGVIWAGGSLFAFVGTSKIGLARAAGTWVPLNIAMGFVWGALLFGEFHRATGRQLALLGVAIVVILAGLVLIIFSRGLGGSSSGRVLLGGLAAAAAAGLLWGTYFIPAQLSATPAWVANLPLSVGMAVGGALLAARHRVRPALPAARDYGLLLLSGLLFGIGDIGLLLMVAAIGTGTGFTIAQLALVVNASLGVFVFRNPPPRTRAAALTMAGVVLAGAGGILLGNLG